jgi:hypothetical protein
MSVCVTSNDTGATSATASRRVLHGRHTHLHLTENTVELLVVAIHKLGDPIRDKDDTSEIHGEDAERHVQLILQGRHPRGDMGADIQTEC